MAAPAAQAAFVRAMQQPGAYARLHPVAGTVRCIETHVSWVFLTGPYAYKVKKPLRLAFLDYSSAGRRAAFCAEELRLNQRSAPALYVDVVPISGTPAAPQVGDTSAPPFEHALRMRQFDPAQELTQLLRTATVTTDELAVFGIRIAGLHAAAPRTDPALLPGDALAVHRITLDNLDELARAMPDPAAATQRARLRRLVDTRFGDVRDVLGQRRAAGQVRECHGDLHCGNVVRWQGALLAFDALEFDPALRWIDVASDLAFLTMDLATHGRDDLRRAVLQAWLETSGDFEAVALLPYFEAYRALVRAKVAALRARQSPVAADTASAQARPVPGLDRAARHARPAAGGRHEPACPGRARPGWRNASLPQSAGWCCARTSNASGSRACSRCSRRTRRPTPASTRASSTRAPTRASASARRIASRAASTW